MDWKAMPTVQPARVDSRCTPVSTFSPATERLALTSSGQVRYQLKTAYRDGTTHIVMEPLDLMARLAALIPPPRMHLTRYHGVFAAHSQLRAMVTPAMRGVKATKPADPSGEAQQSATPRHVAMSWAKRLKRVFGVDIEGCARFGRKLKIIARIEEPEVIARILAHLEKAARDDSRPELVPRAAWAPPAQSPLL
jgi:Putative transposase